VRRGKSDIRNLAVDMGTKSESEIRTYIQILQIAAADLELHAAHRYRLFNTSEIKAATEISDDCSRALDIAADALVALQQTEDEKLERKLHQEHWLLTPATAKRIDRLIQDGQATDTRSENVFPAAELLNLGQFLRLSKRFFMNSSVLECNYRTYMERRRTPSITYTAFSDIHRIAINATKRLLQSALFFAASRLRAEQSYSAPDKSVRREDVLAAVDVLGMKDSAKAFWVSMARRNRHIVYERVRHRLAYGNVLKYDEVEENLSQNLYRSHDQVNRDMEDQSDDAMDNMDNSDGEHGFRGIESDSLSCTEAIQDSISDADSSTSSDDNISASAARDLEGSNTDISPKFPENRRRHDRQTQERLHDDYMETMDRIASQSEERRLWKMLNRDSEGPNDFVESQRSKAPLPPAKDKDDMTDWRSWIEYAGEWETIQLP